MARSKVYNSKDIHYSRSVLKGPVHQLDMKVLIKGHCHCDQNAIGVDNKGVGLCDEAVPVQVRPKGGWESRNSFVHTAIHP